MSRKVDHITVDKNGNSKLLVTIPISIRAGMAEASERLGMSQQNIVRSALAAFLVQHEVPEKVTVKVTKTRKRRAKS